MLSKTNASNTLFYGDNLSIFREAYFEETPS